MKQIIFIIIGSWFLLSVMGCKPDPPIKNEVSTMDITINHVFDASDFELNQEYTLPSDEPVKFSRFAYLLSNFYLIDENEFRIALDKQYLYVDIKSSNSDFKLISIPKGTYKGIGFSIGLDSITNHGNPNQYNSDHPLSPINNSLHWSWQGGYIFTAIEGKTIANNESFIFHLAGTQNKVDFELPYNFSKEDDAIHAVLNCNIKEVFQSPEVYTIEIDGSSTHNVEDPVTLKLINNMKDVFSVSSIGSL